MTAGKRSASFEMKLTVARDECPSVFDALSRIGDAKHRARRLRDLASKGLLLEAHGLAIGSSAIIPRSTPAPALVEAVSSPNAAATVGDSLDWDPDVT